MSDFPSGPYADEILGETWPGTSETLIKQVPNELWASVLQLLEHTSTGLLRIDRAAGGREARYDGKWLLRTSDLTLTPEDLAAAYKQLLAVERGWRDGRVAGGSRTLRLPQNRT